MEPLADFFRYGSSGGFLFFWSMMVEEIVFQNKNVISWECEPRKMKIGVCGLVIPEIHPLFNQTVGFAYTFGWAKQRGKQPPKGSNLFRKF